MLKMLRRWADKSTVVVLRRKVTEEQHKQINYKLKIKAENEHDKMSKYAEHKRFDNWNLNSNKALKSVLNEFN